MPSARRYLTLAVMFFGCGCHWLFPFDPAPNTSDRGSAEARPREAGQADRAAPEAWVVTGTYNGDGAANRRFIVGFRPEVLLIKTDAPAADDAAASAVLRSSTMPPGTAKLLQGNLPLLGNLVLSFDPQGFTVGNDPRVNGAPPNCAQGNCIYYFAAFRASSHLSCGTYVGNGTAGQTIPAGLAFTPDYLMVMSEERRAVHRMGTVEESNPFTAGGPYPAAVSALVPGGFEVAFDSATYEGTLTNRGGVTHHFVAWGGLAGKIKVGSYTGNGQSRRLIDQVGFHPEYVILQSGDQGNDAHQRMAAMPAPGSLSFRGALQPALILGLESDGFRIGGQDPVNQADTSCPALGCPFGYVAFGR